MRIHSISLVLGFAMFALAPATAVAQRQAQRAKTPIAQTTVDNLNKAIEGEANASHRYSLFARKADEEGYHQVAKLFRAASLAESIHRANHEAVLREQGIEPKQPVMETVKVGTTQENLEVPIKGEAQEESEMYPAFIEQAQRDNAPAAVRSFTYALNTEAEHAKLFKDARARLGNNPATPYYVGKVSGDTVTRMPVSPREPYTKVN